MYLSKESIVSDRKRCAFIISPLLLCCTFWKGFPCGSASKDSPCNAGDLGLIPGLGRYPGGGKGYPLQYNPWGHKESDTAEQLLLSLSSVAQKVKNLPVMQEIQVQSLGLEAPPGEGNSYLLQYSCLENPMHRETWQATVHGVSNNLTRLSD